MRQKKNKSAARCGIISLLLLFVLTATHAHGQQVREIEDREIDAAFVKETIDSVSLALKEFYVFPEVAAKMEKYLRQQQKDNRYRETKSAREFFGQLTEDLQHISKDLHLGVGYATNEQIQMWEDTSTDEAEWERQVGVSKRRNFGFTEIRLLDGNIGYLNLLGFSGTGYGAEEVAVAAMNFLSNADAIIIDLRQNGGGSPDMIGLISSYFFEEPVHLNTFYVRQTDSLRQFWTSPFVDGPRLAEKDLYILTSSRTFSAAEEFSYNMRNLERAKLVGETTGGGAHPVDDHYFAKLNVSFRVPFGRAINPITGTNWEGVGVQPHIDVPADQALEVAHLEALRGIRDKIEDEEQAYIVDWAITSLNAKNNPISVNLEALTSYVGTYGPRHITVEDGTLYYQREDRPRMAAIPISDDMFMFPELDFFRIRFDKDENGKVFRITGIYQGGQQDANEKNSDT